VSALCAIMLAGCASLAGGSPSVDPEPIAEPDPAVGADPAPPAGGDSALENLELVVYSGRSESLVGPILEGFESEFGIRVAVRWGNTAEVAATILEEGDASPADLFYAQDPGGLGALSGRFIFLPDHILSRVDPQFRDPEGRWVGVSGRARVIVYNTDTVDPVELPVDLWGFTEPEWDGRLAWAPTNASFQTMVTSMRVLWGEDMTRQWLERMLANHPIVYDSNTPIVASVGAGEADVGLVNHYYLYRFLSEEGEDFPVRNYFLPGGGPGSLVMVSGAGVLETSNNKDAAISLLGFLLSEEAQSYFAEQTNEYPLVDGVVPAVDLIPLQGLNVADVSLSDLSDLEGTLDLLREVGALP
jgi:iron(III) transport system substrate-binding protein